MNFIDSYKKLEKLCNEMYGDKHGVSLYIDEMINTLIFGHTNLFRVLIFLEVRLRLLVALIDQLDHQKQRFP